MFFSLHFAHFALQHWTQAALSIQRSYFAMASVGPLVMLLGGANFQPVSVYVFCTPGQSFNYTTAKCAVSSAALC